MSASLTVVVVLAVVVLAEAEREKRAKIIAAEGEQLAAAQLRVDSIRSSTAAGSGHPTSSMSAADLLAVLVARHLCSDWDEPHSPDNDHLIFSKGHASPLLYSVFRAVGVVSEQELLGGYRRFGQRLQGHPTPALPLGGRGHRVARPGTGRRGRDRPGRQVP